MTRLKKWGKRLRNLLIFTVLLVLFLEWWLSISPPPITDTSAWTLERSKNGNDFYRIKNNWLQKNEHGLWEAYIEGKPFERGAILGNLAQELIVQQEVYFVRQIKALIPSDAFLYLLRYMVGFFNRNLDEYIPIEYQQEIYGETHFCSNEFNAIGSNYERILNYHAAHDIGHALKDYAVVGCTSFSSWKEKSADSSLIIGRNFDFYVGDDFAKDKMVLFINPEEGYQLATVTWGGFLGVVSGMNEKGLTVTLNAAKSGLPTSAKTPISIVARKILQYAKNIEEAYQIAQQYETFVSESLMIGSAEDGRTAIIEKSVNQIALYYSDDNEIICSNHYQSNAFQTDSDNLNNIATSASNYRQIRTQNLMQKHTPLDYQAVAHILRDKQGHQGVDIGLGNEKALNQLQGHHSVIFMPEQRLMWVSTAPYQLGEFVAYDLNSIFNQKKVPNRSVGVDSLLIAQDSFALSTDFKNYVKFRQLKKELTLLAQNGTSCTSEEEKKAALIIELNPDYYHAYELAGNFYKAKQNYQKAISAYTTALSKEVATAAERTLILENLEACKMAVQEQNNS
ncbi:C45 family autoproteolytic acyltransferase/hydolase [Aureispira anguillae]|uniref:C45 family peptidase n=1 Tax=Aureispira anguillae TaxID=2864201 RepID=A0A915YM08_9BACT|nr:C45 family peptidase [Aureispira anguillae]BDS15570.1 C45 family peptidase [Aureispira anguillae]